MSDDEEKPMLISQDLLEQVLRNQITILWNFYALEHMKKDRRKRIAETEALLERLKTS